MTRDVVRGIKTKADSVREIALEDVGFEEDQPDTVHIGTANINNNNNQQEQHYLGAHLRLVDL
eukprot:CAMPEP_0202476090 /NCGR_PEP_ID=MMETSP1360-20130828/93237_1 /ASSEMBLY_ACC=CAM_ASM_000848 /TAXON_ID=515479 /ORGANISM="Licmophora paradoxa, Strain CCMP2313" /LENGTH=62 /DNA_ID=CAMNT_0049103279 /DNA_START=1375 /DNA_END=1563 /DNA_ORIENTATION=+